MITKFKELSTGVQLLSGTAVALATLVGMGAVGYDHFHTDAEAAEHVKDFESFQIQQRKERKIDRVELLKLKKAEIDYQLLSNDLNELQRQYLTNQRSDLDKQIRCIETGEC